MTTRLLMAFALLVGIVLLTLIRLGQPVPMVDAQEDNDFEINPGTVARSNLQICDSINPSFLSKLDCEALVDLYISTNGNGWTDNGGWLVTSNFCSWYGVTCSTTPPQVVTSLWLTSNNLSGSIPPTVGNLTFLKHFSVGDNNLIGSIPTTLGSLTDLEHLNLGGNNLVGSIPPNFHNLTNLAALYLYKNQLDGTIPSGLGNLNKLEILNWENNQLSGSIPAELGSLTNLLTFESDDNQFTGTLPPEIGNLAKIERMELDGNHLTGSIPPELGNLLSVKRLNLGRNNFVGNVPSSIGNLISLTELFLNENQLNGQIPPELGRLVNLETLELNGNKLTGALPGSLTDLQALKNFSFVNTELCEPSNKVVQDWLNTIAGELVSTQVKCDNQLVVFVHGCCLGSGKTFEKVPEYLAESGYHVYVIGAPKDHEITYYAPGSREPVDKGREVPGLEGVSRLLPRTKPILTSAENLVIMLDDAKHLASKRADEKVILVTHSKGGLVSRAYIEGELDKNRNDVEKVIMFGTPNLGSLGGYIWLRFAYEGWELTDIYVKYIFNHKHSIRDPDVDYFLVAGDVNPSNPAILGADDLVVAVNSVHGIPDNGNNVKYIKRPDAAHTNVIKSIYGGYFEERAYNECILPLIVGNQSNCNGQGDTNVVATRSSTVTSFPELIRADSIIANVKTSETITKTLYIDTNGHSEVQLLWGEGELGLTIFDPDGNPINPSTASTDPNIDYLTFSITDSMVAMARYHMTSTTKGAYTLEIAGMDTPATGSDFMILTFVESSLNLKVSTDKNLYTPNEEVVLSGGVFDKGIGINSAVASALVHYPDGITQTLIMLSANGDGRYSSIFTQTTQSGYYSIDFEATGILSNTPYIRTQQEQFAVTSDNASLVGNYNDVPEDLNSDGYYEGLNVTVGVNTIVAGNYTLAALLKDSKNITITNQVVYVDLPVGFSTVTIPFEGEHIYRHGVDGPYIVTEIRVYDNTNISILADEGMNVHITKHYDYTKFGSPVTRKVYLPLILK